MMMLVTMGNLFSTAWNGGMSFLSFMSTMMQWMWNLMFGWLS